MTARHAESITVSKPHGHGHANVRELHQLIRTRSYSCPMPDDELMMLVRRLMSNEKVTGELKIFFARGSANTVLFEERTQVSPE